ncbi:MAG: response regulator transcription factor [Chloroflexi bacterium]|nr:response regulator transcription factor [Chloroflexota bacterium]OJV99099.1 MAG: DNA-binding response regulator [Chloroflexi bacterium 54-19]
MLIADDHAVLRTGLKMLLDAQPDITVIGEAGNGHEVVQLAAELKPDLILLDLAMPGLGGLEALPYLRKIVPPARIVVLTMHDDQSYLRQALREGVSGYMLKKAADSELIAAIHVVMRGEIYVHPSLNRILLEEMLPEPTAANAANPWELLSDRERDVLLLVARGHTSAQIGDRLGLSPKTVETYRGRGMEKLGLRTRAALVQFTLTHQLLTDSTTAS